MLRWFSLLLLLTSAVACLAANTTVVMNGKTVNVPVVLVDGKAYLDAAALMKLLGGSASFNVAANKVTLSTRAGAGPAVELAGNNGHPGSTYVVGKSSPVYFCLNSAEYTTQPLIIGTTLYAPKADEKLLLLRFTLQNPQQADLFVRWDSLLRLTAVDAMNVNHAADQNWGDAESHEPVEMSLKPAQKLDVYTAITVPAKGIVPKLMVQSVVEGDGPVLRYDLHGVVTPLPAPIADPADPTGATARPTVPAQVGTAYPYGNFAVTVESITTTTDALDGDPPAEDGSYLAVTLRMKNCSPIETLARWDTFTPHCTSTDGEELKFHPALLFASTNRPIEQNLKPDQEVLARIYFEVPNGVTAKTLVLKEGDGRGYKFTITR